MSASDLRSRWTCAGGSHDMITLAADFGGRRIKLGLIQNGRITAQEVLPALADRSLRERLGAVANALNKLCEQENIRPRECAGIGISYPSVIDVPHARVVDHFGK